MSLILASQSASRRAMLTAAGVPFEATFAGVDEDVELWTPGAVGDREITDKNLRKRVREAQRAADGTRLAAGSEGPEAAAE